MANILGIQTVNGILIIQTDVNPTLTGGVDAPVGSMALAGDGSGFFYKNGASLTDWNEGATSGNLSGLNVLLVRKNPTTGQYATIEDAINAITLPSDTNRWLILVGVGQFTENTLVLPNYVSVVGASIQETQIFPATSTQHIFELGAYNEISFMWLEGAGAGYSAIHVNDSGNYSQAHKVTFNNNDINILIESSTQDTFFYGEYLDFNGTYSFGLKLIATNGFEAFANIENYYNFPTGGVPICNFLTGVGADAHLLAGGCEGIDVGTAFYLEDGANLQLTAFNINNFDKCIHNGNVGTACNFLVSGVVTKDIVTYDIQIEHTGTTGTIGGAFDDSKIINASSLVGLLVQDTNDGSLLITNKLNVLFSNGTITDVSTLITEGATMGVIDGGILSDGGGFVVDISQGFGYFEQFPADVVQRLDWNTTSITLSANVDVFIYFNNNGTLTSNGAQPDTRFNILLGRVVTNGTGIEFIDESPLRAEHTSNLILNNLREAIGSIYASGSIVTENATPLHLDVTGGEYYYGENEFIPSGGTDITFTSIYGQGSGVITGQTAVDNTQYDVSGTLTPLTAGYYAKGSIYLVGQGANEKYYFVFAQAEYSTLLAVQQADIPLPPNSFTGSVVLIAGIIVQEGNPNIVQVVDQRPIIGYRAFGVTASADHLSLLNLNGGVNGDGGHTNMFTVNGAKPMTGNMDMGTNNIFNAGTFNAVVVEAHASRHLPNGADPLTSAAPTTNLSGSSANSVGIQNSFSRSDHSHAITGAALTKVDDTNVTLTLGGSASTALLNAASLTLGWTGTLSETRGGTAQSTYVAGDILYASAADTLSKLPIGTNGQQLTIVAGVPAWSSGGTGTVTSVSVTTNQGVSGVVSNPTTTPAITLSLGALTGVTSINGLIITADTGVITTGTWNGTAISNANLANSSVTIGTTNISLGATSLTLAGLSSVTSTTFVGALTGNSSTATALQTARTINGTSFDGTANITITAAAGTLTGTTLNAIVVSSSLTSVGTLTGGATGAGFTIALGTSTITGTLSETNGGTGQSTYTTGDLLYASAANTLSKLSIGSAGSFLRSSGTTVSWSTTTFPNAAAAGDLIYATSLNNFDVLPIGTNGQVLKIVAGVPTWSTDIVGTGTVTSVSVVTANGVSGSVSNPTTTPAITLTLGAITPTSVNGNTFTTGTGTLTLSTFTLTVAATSSISGINTGDQTINLTGEATGSGTGSFAVTLTNSAVIGKVLTGYVSGAGVVSATDTILQAIEKLNGNISALVTGVSSVSGTSNRITSTGGSTPVIDISASYVGQTSITTLGTVTTGVWNGTAIANANLANSSLTIGSTNISLGATSLVLAGLTSVTSTTFVGALTGNSSTATALQTARTINGTSFNGTANITITAAAGTLTGTTLNATVVSSSLTSVGTLTGGATGAGFTIALGTSTITGTLGATNGGTSFSTYVTGDIIYASAANTLSKLPIGTAGQVLTIVAGVPTWATDSGTGTVTSVTLSTGTTGLTGGSTITTSGTWTLAGTLVAANGGTGQNTYVVGDLLYADTTTTLAKLADVATGNALISGGVGVAPSWGKIGLTTHVSGTLPIANGGTGQITAILAFNALSPLTTKGDIVTRNGTDNIRQGVGSNTQVLIADSSQASGIRWGDVNSSIISPAAFAATQNNYNPAGLADAVVLRLTSTGAQSITGIVAPATTKTIIIFNIGAANIALTNASASSTAANRFEFGGNKLLNPNEGITLWYDITTARWRASGASL
jgi:hypothetical protein